MQWVRTNRRFGAWWALVAIALQVVLSFGHTHRTDSIRTGAHASATVLHASAAVQRGAPDSQPGTTPSEYCAVCAVIKLATSTVPPDAPAWCLPSRAGEVGFAPCAQVAVRTLDHQPFHARAPPPV